MIAMAKTRRKRAESMAPAWLAGAPSGSSSSLPKRLKAKAARATTAMTATAASTDRISNVSLRQVPGSTNSEHESCSFQCGGLSSSLTISVGLTAVGHAPVVAAGDHLLDPDLGADQRAADPAFAAQGAPHLAGVRPVPPARPGRAGPGDADRADVQQERDEDAQQAGPDLALQQGDHGDQKIDDQ